MYAIVPHWPCESNMVVDWVKGDDFQDLIVASSLGV